MSTGKEHVVQTEAQREQLRQLEEERRRQACAGFESQISQQLSEYSRLQQQLDKAKSTLPDLTYQLPVMQVFSGNRHAPLELERYNRELTQQINSANQTMQQAIRAAEVMLAERLALANAWQELKAMNNAANAQEQVLNSLASQLSTKKLESNIPALPSDTADIATVKNAILAYQQFMREQTLRHTQIIHQINTNELVMKSAGQRVQTQYNAQGQLSAYEQHLLDEKKQKAQEKVEQKLAALHLSRSVLPAYLQTMITNTLSLAPALADAGGLLSRVLDQYHGLLEESKKAKTMLQKPPLELQDVPILQQRWSQLATQLQRVANGQQSFLGQFEHEYAQLRCDEQKVIRDRAAMLVVAKSAEKTGLAIDATTDGGWMLHDPQDTKWHARATAATHPQGIHIHYDLNVDPQSTERDEQQATKAFCQKLQSMQQTTAQQTKTRNKVAESVNAPAKPKRNKKPAINKKKSATLPLQ